MNSKIKNLFSSKIKLNILVVFFIFFYFLFKFLNYEKYELSFNVESASLDQVEQIFNSEQIKNNSLYNKLFIRRVGIGKAQIYLITQNELNEAKSFLENIRDLFVIENQRAITNYINDVLDKSFFISNQIKGRTNQTIQEFDEYKNLLLKNTNIAEELSKLKIANYNLGEIEIKIVNKNFVTVTDILSLMFFILFVYIFFYVFVYDIKKK